MAKFINFTTAVQGVGAAGTTVTVTTSPTTLGTFNGSTTVLQINCDGHGLSVFSPISVRWSSVGDANAAALGIAGDYYVSEVVDVNNIRIIPTAATSATNTTGTLAVTRRIASPVIIDPNRIIQISNPSTSAVDLKLRTSNTGIETLRIAFAADSQYGTHEAIAQAITRAASDSMGYSGASFDLSSLPESRVVGFTRF